MRVLLGVDGSEESLNAVTMAGRLLSPERDELTFYFAAPPVGLHLLRSAASGLDRLQLKLADAIFEKSLRRLPPEKHFDVRTVATSEGVHEGLLRAAENCNAELVVIGARGTGPLKQSLLGSVARHVIDHAMASVMVVRGFLLQSPGPINVLLASDRAESCRRASRLLSRFTWPTGSVGRTITVLEPQAQGPLPEWLAEELEDQQLKSLGMGTFARDDAEEARVRDDRLKWHGTLPAIFEGGDALVVTGHAAEAILKAIREHQIDIAVVGARRMSGVRRLLLGSTSTQVVAQAPCSIIVIRGESEQQ
jgi:nucleotide-binding universal stress UspA family protein